LGLVSCGDAASSFDDSTLPGGSSTGATSGDGSGATSSQGGSSSNNSGGSKASAGSENSSAGTDNGSAGTNNGDGGTSTGNAGNGNAGADSGGGTSGGGKGGTGNGNGGSAQAGTGNGGSAQAGTSNGGSAGSGGSASNGGSAGSSGSAGSGGSGGTGSTGATCPDKIFGSYDIVTAQGNCNNLNDNASQSIAGTDVACVAHFVSLPPNPGGNTAVNGAVQLDENGNFSGASLYLSKTQRMPCSGKWDAGQERMTIKCGNGGEACTVVLDLK
jgi:hypothetical protein